AVSELRVDLTRMDRAARPQEGENVLFAPAAPACGGARVHQTVDAARHEAVVDEDVLFDVERVIQALEIPGAVAGDAMAQREGLRARRRANRICLHEAERVEGSRQ